MYSMDSVSMYPYQHKRTCTLCQNVLHLLYVPGTPLFDGGVCETVPKIRPPLSTVVPLSTYGTPVTFSPSSKVEQRSYAQI